MLFHSVTREIVVVGLGRKGRTPVDELHNGDRGIATEGMKKTPIQIVMQFTWKFRLEAPDRTAHHLQLTKNVRIQARAARISDLFLALSDIEQRLGHRSLRAEQVELKHAHVLTRSAAVEHVLQRCVRDESAVPIGFAIDFDWRKAWG